MQAIRNGNIDTVKLLLERKADVNQMTYLGKQVFMIAVNSRYQGENFKMLTLTYLKRDLL